MWLYELRAGCLYKLSSRSVYSGLSNSLELPIGNLDLIFLWPFVKVFKTKNKYNVKKMKYHIKALQVLKDSVFAWRNYLIWHDTTFLWPFVKVLLKLRLFYLNCQHCIILRLKNANILFCQAKQRFEKIAVFAWSIYPIGVQLHIHQCYYRLGFLCWARILAKANVI